MNFDFEILRVDCIFFSFTGKHAAGCFPGSGRDAEPCTRKFISWPFVPKPRGCSSGPPNTSQDAVTARDWFVGTILVEGY